MESGPSRSIVIGFTILASLGLRASEVHAQQTPAIEIAFPNQLVRGQSNVVHVAIPSREMFAGAEVSPAAGVTVSRVINSKKPELSQNVAWWDVTLDVNAKGVFLGCKYGIPALRRAGGGSIINTASFVARLGAATPQIAYTASKGAVLSMTYSVAKDYLNHNIRCNCISPARNAACAPHRYRRQARTKRSSYISVTRSRASSNRRSQCSSVKA